ncbi:unnamed protein product, partial [marine sediment metagenome]
MLMEQEHKWVGATPASLLLVFVITGSFWAFLTGRVSPSALPLIGAYFLGFGILWLIAAVIDFRMGDLLGGAINGVFGILLGIAPGMSFLIGGFGAAVGMPVDPRIDGWFIFYAGIIFIVPFAIAAAKRLWLLGLPLLILGITFIILGLALAGLISPGVLPVGGWLLLLAGIIMLYVAVSM